MSKARPKEREVKETRPPNDTDRLILYESGRRGRVWVSGYPWEVER